MTTTTVATATTRIVGASAIGAGHLRRGVGCQDRFASEIIGDVVLLAVSDGLGSALHAEVGAEAAAGAAVRSGRALLRAEPSCPLGFAARQMVACARAALQVHDRPLSDLACTLIAVAARATDVAVAHIGDGAVVGVRGVEVLMLSPPAPSEYANEVVPLTAAAWDEHVRVSPCVAGIDAVLALTDGCQHAALTARGEPSAAFAGPIVDHVRGAGEAARSDLEALLSGDKLAEHSDDDKTLVVAVLEP